MQVYIFCKILWWWGEGGWLLGKKIKLRVWGENEKEGERGKGKGKKDILVILVDFGGSSQLN